MINSHQAYNLYMTTKKHFTNKSFNVFDNKTVKIPKSRFIYRPERYRMERLVNRFDTAKDLIQYFVANFALDNSNFLYESEDSGDICYARWISYKQALTYNFKSDMEYILENVTGRIQDNPNAILTMMLSNKISIQSVAILDDIYNFLTCWENNVNMSTLFDVHVQRVRKTQPFVKYDRETLTQVARGIEREVYECV